MEAGGEARRPGLLEDAGEVVAASVRAHPVLWVAAGVVLLSTPLWAPTATAVLSVAAAASVIGRLPLVPRAALRRGWAWVLLLVTAAAAACFDSERTAELVWGAQCGLSTAVTLLLAVAAAHALRRPPSPDADAALKRVVESLRRAPTAVAALAFAGAVPADALLGVACQSLDASFAGRHGYGGAWALVGAESLTGAWPTVLLLAVLLGPTPVGRSLLACILGLVLASAARAVAADAAHAYDPWDGFEAWTAHRFPHLVNEVVGITLCFLIRGVRVVEGRALGRGLSVLLLAYWSAIRVGADVPQTWWSTQEPRVSLGSVVAGLTITVSQVAVMTAALMLPLRGGTLVAIASVSAALTSMWAGSAWETPRLGMEAAPIAAAGGALDAALLLAAREARRALGVGRPREPAPEDADEDLPWAEGAVAGEDRQGA